MVISCYCALQAPAMPVTVGFEKCEDTPGMPANATVSTNDYLLNLTGHDVSMWIVKTMQPYIKKRLVCAGSHPPIACE